MDKEFIGVVLVLVFSVILIFSLSVLRITKEKIETQTCINYGFEYMEYFTNEQCYKCVKKDNHTSNVGYVLNYSGCVK